MSRKKEPTTGTRTLAVKKKDGEYQIEIPADALLTFGPAIPNSGTGKDRAYGDPRREYALRVYRGTKTNILAVFTGVEEFREIDQFKVKKKVISEAGQTIWKSDEEGFEISKKVKREGKWVDEAVAIPQVGRLGTGDPF